VHREGKASLEASVDFLQNYLTSFANANRQSVDKKGQGLVFSSQGQVTNLVNEKSEWKAPPMGVLKVNVDAGWDNLSQRTGICIVIRDGNGSVVRAAWTHIPFLCQC
jgi:prophage DNA circulation protein